MAYLPQTKNFKTTTGLSTLQKSIYQVEFTIVPQKDLFYDLGQSNLRWGSVYTGTVLATSGVSTINTLDITNSINVLSQNFADSSFQGGVNVFGKLTAGGLSNNSSVDATSNMDVDASFYTAGGIACTKSLYADNLHSVNSASIGTDLDVGGNTVIDGTLTVTGGYIGIPSDLTPPVTIGTLSDTVIDSYSVHPTTNIVTPTNVLSTPSINTTQQLTTPWLSVMGLATVDKFYSTNTTDATTSTDSAAAMKIDGGMAVTKSIYTGGTFNVTGATSLSTLSTSGAATLNSLACTNNATVGGTLTVNSTTEAGTGTGSIVTAGGIYSAKRIRIGSTDTGFVTPSFYTAGSAVFTAGVQCNSTLAATGNTSLSTLSTSGASTVGGALTVNSTTEAGTGTGSIVTAGGIYSAKRIRIGSTDTGFVTPSFYTAGSAVFTAGVQCNSTLAVTGNTSITGTLGAGNTTVTGSLSSTTGTTLASASGTTTIGSSNAVTISSSGSALVPSTSSQTFRHGQIFTGSSSYSNVGDSQHMIAGTYAYTSGNHAAQLLLLDNSSTAGDGGNCGGVTFAGPAKNFGTQFYQAAGRIRGVNTAAIYGGTINIETLSTGGNLLTAVKFNPDQTSTFTSTLTVTAGGLTVTAGGLTVTAGTTALAATNITGILTTADTYITGVLTTSGGINMSGTIASKVGTAGISYANAKTSLNSSGNYTPITGFNARGLYERSTAATPNDTLPSTSTIISAVAAYNVTNNWGDNEYVDFVARNLCAGTWNIARGDSNLTFNGGATSYNILTGDTAYFRLLKTSSTTIAMRGF